jgi:hypothetical protein
MVGGEGGDIGKVFIERERFNGGIGRQKKYVYL